LGRKYYESHKDDDSAESRRIQEIYTEISDTKDELADIRGEVVCPKCGEYVPKNAKFCPNCGNDMNVFEESDTVDAEAFEEEDADDTETVNPAEDDKTDNQPKEN
ncbi:MAG: zinc-ribbon domain-containing protein, partial [Candidatus Weimeria sp.]